MAPVPLFNSHYIVPYDHSLYLIRLDLDRINGYKRLLSNCYITKSNGETTEVDLIMIHETGIYVFESKNYGGWIFGEEDSEQWMQAFKSGEKNNFFNPIMQNKGHIYAIKKVLSMYDDSTFKSIVVFGNGCTFKKMRVRTPVIHRKDVVRVVQKLIKKRPPIFTEEQVDELYEKLFPYTQVSQNVKEKHIQEIESKYR